MGMMPAWGPVACIPRSSSINWQRPCRLLAGGHGSAGVRERVAIFAGTLETCRLPDGGFLVRAVLPLKSGGDMGVAG